MDPRAPGTIRSTTGGIERRDPPVSGHRCEVTGPYQGSQQVTTGAAGTVPGPCTATGQAETQPEEGQALVGSKQLPEDCCSALGTTRGLQGHGLQCLKVRTRRCQGSFRGVARSKAEARGLRPRWHGHTLEHSKIFAWDGWERPL